MTTTQAAPNGHCVSPPFLESEISDLQSPVASASPDAQHSAAPAATDAPASERQNAPFAASAYHVPPKLFTPKADSFRNTIPEGWGRTKLPDRCQFMFSDGRQCTMARSDIHPSLCVYHSDREEQLFGDPGQRCEARTLDFPELHSACRDLSTARGVNRALAQVFRMLARGRISRQEAATFGHLAKLLLRTISLIAVESTIRPGSSSRATNWSEEPLPEFVSADEPKNLSASSPANANSSTLPIPTSPEPPAQRVRMSNNSRKISTSAPSICNSPEISTSEIAGLNPIQNQHLHKSVVSALCSSGRPPKPGSPARADFACAGVVEPAFEAKAET